MNLRSALAVALKTISDSRYRQFYLQRRELDVDRRIDTARRIAASLPRPSELVSPLERDKGAELEQRGYTMLPELVAQRQVQEMHDYFSSQLAHDPYRPELGRYPAPQGVPPDTHVSHYNHDQIAQAPHVLEIANSPLVLALVGNFLGAKPTIGCIRVWWSTPASSGEPEHAEKFHRDVDDWRFVKLFVYLTDVDEDAGPHIFAAGSQKINALTEIRRFEDAEIEATAGRENIVRFLGPAGTTFLENTYGLHKGLPPRTKPRLVLQVLYTLRPVIFGPEIPVLKSAAGKQPFDPYVSRVYCAT